MENLKEIYGNVKGFISRTSFKQNGGVIHIRYDKDDNIMAREHLFAESDIDIKQWVLLNCINMCIISTYASVCVWSFSTPYMPGNTIISIFTVMCHSFLFLYHSEKKVEIISTI